MSSVEEKVRPWETGNARTLIEEMKLLGEFKGQQGARKAINSELWHACAGPLISLPQPGDLVYYFPQGHSEQVTASTRRNNNAHVPNYPSLPYQMLCQVHSVVLHADKETDEIYAQMTLQPVNSENDVFRIPDAGLTKSKHPSDYFCKTLTASDTSTHGGFSVPRRAAEKLFPPLDYSSQPPNQELVVLDLHDNSWTFRHIYRGQPKRHLLTSGWSVFVGSKRLKAGDSVLFIRDEKSQLLLGIRRANRQRTVLPSVLSADSMHLGVFAAAAHAAAHRSPFTVYYNPRACPSEFVVPAAKYHKAAYHQISVGTRFGMMFETEDSGKRRYMGTVVGINDCDPLRWPNSKWRNLQVEWDEHSSVERPDRVSPWDIETPESFFVLPALASTLKRQLNPQLPGGEAKKGHASPSSEKVINCTFTFPPIAEVPQSVGSSGLLTSPAAPPFSCLTRGREDDEQEEKSQTLLAELDAVPQPCQLLGGSTPEASHLVPSPSFMGELHQMSQLTPEYMDNSWWSLGGRGGHFSPEDELRSSLLLRPSGNSTASSAEMAGLVDPEMMPSWGQGHLNHNTYACLEGGLDAGTLSCLFLPPEGLHSTSNSCQDVQSQITTASLADCRAVSLQELPDCSGGTSSSNLDADDRCHLNSGSWKQPPPPLRTYTKVHKAGSVGRSIDATRFRNYDELKHAIACMFGLEGQLDEPGGEGWKLVYVDYENDVLLVGDDPWEEFVTCVKCIRILSPSEVQQMSQEGLQLMNMVTSSGEAPL